MRWLIVVGLFVAGLFWLWRSTAEAPSEPPRSEAARPVKAPVRRAYIPQAPLQRLALPPRASTFDATRHHSADPCTALADPIVPATFESVTAAGITVAWEPTEDSALRPTSLAYMIAGILEEAAQLTGTARRPTLTVIVDGDLETFRRRTQAPVWVGGLYDGSAVHLGASRGDLGIAIGTLRHEVMHAQMHATIGCTPFWFNEGLATYFSGRVPVRELVQLMRGEPVDMTTLRAPVIFEADSDTARRMYSASLAMVLAIVHGRGEQGLREVVQLAQAADTIDAALDLWTRMQGDVGYRDVLDTVATKIFGTPTGPALDLLLRDALCCSHLRNVTEVSCRAPVGEERTGCRTY